MLQDRQQKLDFLSANIQMFFGRPPNESMAIRSSQHFKAAPASACARVTQWPKPEAGLDVRQLSGAKRPVVRVLLASIGARHDKMLCKMVDNY